MRSFAAARAASEVGARSNDGDERRTNNFESDLLRQGEHVPRSLHQEKARDLDIAGADRSPDQYEPIGVGP
jgi:hypothetical protein